MNKAGFSVELVNNALLCNQAWLFEVGALSGVCSLFKLHWSKKCMHSTKERATETKIVEGTNESIRPSNMKAGKIHRWTLTDQAQFYMYWVEKIARMFLAVRYFKRVGMPRRFCDQVQKNHKNLKKKKLSFLLDCRICLRLKNNLTNGFMSLPGGR